MVKYAGDLNASSLEIISILSPSFIPKGPIDEQTFYVAYAPLLEVQAPTPGGSA
ncbi:hypothetical protein NSQ43_03440 [Sporosarcina sp. FSL W8-0480]|uniref:hypothetical protein n=1 Tax=Sporosarcina sp. FSL W8-0480 TaxID=2954701 RepID=UPI0030DAD24E